MGKMMKVGQLRKDGGSSTDGWGRRAAQRVSLC